MGDILPSKRQAIVERLRRRFEKYRRHQNACLPRYEHSSNGFYEHNRQEALLLKQRYFETKGKKLKRNDPKSLPRDFGQDRAVSNAFLTTQQKTNKRQANGPTIPSEQNCEDHGHQVKISRNSQSSDCQESPPAIPSFSVQIFQQFTNTSSSCQTPQTIQTNVTVKAVSANSKNSPSGSDISVGTNIECKQEKGTTNRTKSASDRFSDTFSTLEFPTNTSDDVIHPDILKDLIDDVLTNPTDLMKDFNFEETVNKDGEEADKNLECSGADVCAKSNSATSNNSQTHFPPTPPMISPFPNNHTTPPMFESSTPVMTTTPSSTPYSPNPRVQPYTHSSSLNMNPGIGLDFKLTEPSPAAQTLKQMAEQHQSMQQKQQQLGLGLGSPHTRPSFTTDAFSDPLTLPSIHSGFMNGAVSHLSPLQKPSPTPLYSTMGYMPQSEYPCIRSQPTTGLIYKHENSDNLYPGIDGFPHIPDVGMHKRQQIMLLKCNPNYTMDRKPQYGGTRPLSHFTDSPMSGINTPLSSQYSSPSGPTLQMSQSQQITQSPLQPMNSSGPSQSMTTSQQYSGHPQTPNSPPTGTFHFTMSQSQSMSFSAPYSSNRTSSVEVGNLQTPQQMDSMPYINRASSDYKLQTLGDVGHHGIANYANVVRNPGTNNNSQMHRQMSSYRRSDGQDTCLPGGNYLNKSVSSNLKETHIGRSEKPVSTSPSSSKNQRTPNVNIGPDGLNISTSEWRQPMIHDPRISYSQPYTSDMRGITPPQSTEKVQRYPSNQIMMQQQQQLALQGNIPNSAINMQMSQSISMTTDSQMSNQMYPQAGSTPQDGSQINLDFFDDIESSATDLLNFDPMLQTGSSGPHYTLLDEIGIIGK